MQKINIIILINKNKSSGLEEICACNKFTTRNDIQIINAT
jgi:hypothetical protein